MKDKLNALLKDDLIVFEDTIIEDKFNVFVSNTHECIGYNYVIEKITVNKEEMFSLVKSKSSDSHSVGDGTIFWGAHKDKSLEGLMTYLKKDFYSQLIFCILDCSGDAIEEKIIALLRFDIETLKIAISHRIHFKYHNENLKPGGYYASEEYKAIKIGSMCKCFKHIESKEARYEN